MALKLLSRSYGAAYASFPVQIRESRSSAPVRLYARSSGGVVSKDGSIRLDTAGNLQVYVQDDIPLTVTLLDKISLQPIANFTGVNASTDQNPLGGLSVLQASLGATGVAGVTSGGDLVGPAGDTIYADKTKNLRLFNHVLIDFTTSDATVGWSTSANQTISYDATYKGLRIKGNGTAATNILTTKTLPRSLSPSLVQRVAVKFRSNTPGLAAGLYIQLSDGTNFSGLNSAFSLFQVPASDHPDWHWAVFNTAEDAAFANLTTISSIRFRTNTQAAPYLNDLTIQKVVINPQTVSPVAFTFDDGWDTAFTKALPIFSAAKMVGTVFVPTAGAPGVAANRRLTNAQMQALSAAGWAVSLDGTDDDTALTSAASPEAALAKFQNCQLLGTQIGTKLTDLQYTCYPNGSAWVTGSPVQIAAATSNGTTTVTLGAAATIVNGSAYYAANAPDGTTVVTGGVGVTSITVSNSIPSGTVAAAAVDLSSVFTYSAIQTRLAAAGVRGARLTTLGDASIIEGLQNPLLITAYGFTGQSLNQAIATLTTLKNRGVAIVMYMHDVVDDVGGWTANTANPSINVYASFLQGLVNLVKGWADAGQAEVLTFPALVEKYRA